MLRGVTAGGCSRTDAMPGVDLGVVSNVHCPLLLGLPGKLDANVNNALHVRSIRQGTTRTPCVLTATHYDTVCVCIAATSSVKNCKGDSIAQTLLHALQSCRLAEPEDIRPRLEQCCVCSNESTTSKTCRCLVSKKRERNLPRPGVRGQFVLSQPDGETASSN
jgi:hypothetical protein